MSTTGGPIEPANDDHRSDGPQDVVRDHGGEQPWRPQDGPKPIPTDGPREYRGPVEEPKKPFMRKSTAVKLGIGAAAVGGGILLFTAGGDDDPQYAAVCVDQNTQTRIDDDYCDDDGYHGGYTHFGWYYFGYGYSAPRVGGHVSGGSYTVPNSSYVQGGVPRGGGTISKSSVSGGKTTTVRGGFGGSGKGGSS